MQGKGFAVHWCFGSIPTSQSHLLIPAFQNISIPAYFSPCFLLCLLSFLPVLSLKVLPLSPRAPTPHTTCGEGSNSQMRALHLGQYHMKSGSDQFWRDCLCPRLFFWGLCVHKSIHGLGLNESIYTWPREECQQFESLNQPNIFWLNYL